MPSIYVDQTVEALDGENGNNLVREGYLAARQRCADAGLPLKALSETDVAKLGTTRLQRWISDDKAAYRRETWGSENAGSDTHEQMCRFTLVSEGAHVYLDRQRMITLNLDSNEKSEKEPKLTLLDRAGSMSLAEAKNRQLAKVKTLAVEDSPVDSDEAGQPCVQWQSLDDQGTFCLWSGGTQWGFSIQPGKLLVDNGSHLLSRIVLRQEPGRRNPTRVTTNAFTLGGVLDSSTMMPAPASARPSDQQ